MANKNALQVERGRSCRFKEVPHPAGYLKVLSRAIIAIVVLTPMVTGCASKKQDEATDRRIDDALAPFVDANSELRAAANIKLNEGNVQAAMNMLNWHHAIIIEEVLVVVALEATGSNLHEIKTDESKQEMVIRAWDRARKRSNEKGGSSLPSLDCNRLREFLSKRTRLNDEEWSDLHNDVRKLVSEETWDALIRMQEKYSIRQYFIKPLY